ncbi:MAG: hypothetical protein JNK49_10985 [Planctomycetes bacterium]|nr:hypothetical protein [Planctomycetota bacterium]
MSAARWPALGNLGALLSWCGVVALLAGFWMPVRSAQRTADAEQLAEQLNEHLLQASLGCPNALEPDDLPAVLARFWGLAARDRLPVDDLEVLVPPADLLLLLGNRDYLFHLAAVPPDPQAVVSPDSCPTYAAVAWPRHADSLGHTVFFSPSDALPARTRNLVGRHFGMGNHRPMPGQQHRRLRSASSGQRSYRSSNDERWIEGAPPDQRSGVKSTR